MIDIFREEKWITAAMLLLGGISILIRIVLGALYGRMLRETENMAATRNEGLRRCKLKFMNCYRLNNGVSNVNVFVEKFLANMSVGPFRLDQMYHISGQTMLLSVAAVGVGICKGIALGRSLWQIVPFYIACFILLYFYFALSAALDIVGMRKMLKIQLVDYLENHLSARIGTAQEDMDMLYGEQKGKRIVEVRPVGSRLRVMTPSGRKRGNMLVPEEAGAKAAEVPRNTRAENEAAFYGTIRQEPSEMEKPGEDVQTAEELEELLKEILTI